MLKAETILKTRTNLNNVLPYSNAHTRANSVDPVLTATNPCQHCLEDSVIVPLYLSIKKLRKIMVTKFKGKLQAENQ